MRGSKGVFSKVSSRVKSDTAFMYQRKGIHMIETDCRFSDKFFRYHREMGVVHQNELMLLSERGKSLGRIFTKESIEE